MNAYWVPLVGEKSIFFDQRNSVNVSANIQFQFIVFELVDWTTKKIQISRLGGFWKNAIGRIEFERS